MKASDFLSALWLLLLMAAVSYVGGAFASQSAPQAVRGARASVDDVTGRAVPLRAYRHIASSSAVADGLLLELAEPERILALSHQGRLDDPDRHRYGARAEVSGPGDLERLIALGADLLIVNHLGAAAELARVRASGIEVFDLGEMRGASTLHPSMLALASVLGDRARGERLWQRFSRRLQAVADDIPQAQRRAALYVAVYAGKIYGGTLGTSYHEVLEAAGLEDVAATHYRDWPQYDPEQLLALDPALIVTNTGMASELCGNVWLQRLHACKQAPPAVVEVSGQLIGDAGLRMLEAAEELHARVYGAKQR